MVVIVSGFLSFSGSSLKYLNIRGLHVFAHNLCMSVCEIAFSVPKVVNEISSAQ